MSNKRATRVASLLHEVLSEILSNQLKDPAVGPVIISRVSVTADLKIARVFFHHLGREHDPKATSAGLLRASGFMRTELAKRVDLRAVPRLEFIYDDSLDRAERIEELLRQANEDQDD